MSEAMNSHYDIRTVVPHDTSRFAVELREDKDFYIPDFLVDAPSDVSPAHRKAADAHLDGLTRAGRRLDEALNLTRTLRAALEDDAGRRGMQADTVLGLVETRLAKAQSGIDRHAMQCRRLFLAYAALEARHDDDGD